MAAYFFYCPETLLLIPAQEQLATHVPNAAMCVSSKQRAICCDMCDQWVHLKCIPEMTVNEYKALGDSSDPWYCSRTCNPLTENRIYGDGLYFSESFFDSSSISSVTDDNPFTFTESFFNESVSLDGNNITDNSQNVH